MMRWFLAYWFTLASAINPALAALTINNLSGFNVVPVATDPGPTVDFRGCANSTANLTTYTFSSFSVGAAETGRIILVGAVVEDSADNLSPGTMSIGGVGATIASGFSSALTVRQEFGIAALSSGESITISVTWGETVTATSICVWSLYGFSSAAFADQFGGLNDSGAVITNTVDVTSGDLLAAMCLAGGTGETITWDSDFSTTSTRQDNGEFSYAYAYTYPFPTTTINLGLTCDWSGSTDAQMRSVVVSP